MSKPLIELSGLSKYYTSAQSVVMGLNSLDLSFDRGEFVAITGESGSGKSTLSHVIGGILPYESGELLFDGKPTSHYDGMDWELYRRDHISFISQNYGILPGVTVLGNVVSALRLSGMEKKAANARAEAILRQVELWDLRGRRAAKLSSGQKQRLSIARALAKPAPILIADEPTGNLDAENSAKIMALLAQAAKERLVLLVTHEFEEAAPYATRHIVLQDGRVSMDAVLREPDAPAPMPVIDDPGKGPLSPHVARLQVSGRPVWTSLVLGFFALTAFAVFAFLGTFIIALDDTSTRIYDNSAFRNGSRTRIAVVRADGADMTREDYDRILSVRYAESLERFGYVADIQYAYRQGVDFRLKNTAQDVGTWDDPEMILTTQTYMEGAAPFMKTVPAGVEAGTFLTAGRLPENMHEIVMAGAEDLVGTTITVLFQDRKNWNIAYHIGMEMEIVGTTDVGSGIYFADDLGIALTYNARADESLKNLFLVAEDLEDDQFRPHQFYYANWVDRGEGYQEYVIPASGFGTYSLELWQKHKAEYVGLEDYQPLNLIINDFLLPEDDPAWVRPYHPWPVTNMLEISQNTFDRIMPTGCDQVSLTIENYAYTDRVLEALGELGYVAISPFREGSAKQDPALAEERVQTLTVCCAALAAVLLLQIIVLRALFGTQTENYRLLSNIGLTCPTARWSLLWQILLFTAGGQLLGLAGILVCRQMGVERIVYLVRYLRPVYTLALSGVHLAASLLAAWWIIRSITKQVYPFTGQYIDLPLEESGKERDV